MAVREEYPEGSGSGGSDLSSGVVKTDSLDVYDASDNLQGKLTDSSDINMDDVGAYTSDTGVEWVEISTIAGQLYWVKKAELFAFQGKEYKPTVVSGSGTVSDDSGKDVSLISSDSSPIMDDSTPSSDPSGVSSVKKLDQITLYDSNDTPNGLLHNESDILDDDSSYLVDDNGVEWQEIATSFGLFWTKREELFAFLGKPYVPKKPKTKSPKLPSGDSSIGTISMMETVVPKIEVSKLKDVESDESESTETSKTEDFEEIPL